MRLIKIIALLLVLTFALSSCSFLGFINDNQNDADNSSNNDDNINNDNNDNENEDNDKIDCTYYADVNDAGIFTKVKINSILDDVYVQGEKEFVIVQFIVVEDLYNKLRSNDRFTVAFDLNSSLSNRSDLINFITKYEYFYICYSEALPFTSATFEKVANEDRQEKTFYNMLLDSAKLVDYRILPVKDGVLDYQGVYEFLLGCGVQGAHWNDLGISCIDEMIGKSEDEIKKLVLK